MDTSSISRIQSIRFRDEVIYFQTTLLNDSECICIEDIQRRFPSVTALYLNDVQLSFLRDQNGEYLKPLRVKARLNHVIDAIEPTEKSSNDQVNQLLCHINEKVEEIDKKTDRVLANTQEVLVRMKHLMTLMYELHEYTTPRYFFILPVKQHPWKSVNAVHKLFLYHYKLYFLCECSDEPSELHVAPHEGYLIKSPSQFIANYGSYLRTTLNIARGLLSFGGFLLDQSTNVPALIPPNVPNFLQQQTNIDEMTQKLDVVEQMLNQTGHELLHVDSSVKDKSLVPDVPLQGAQLRELAAFLEHVDTNHSLGNLYRTVTDDGHIRWVCLEHYNTICYNNKLNEYIRQFESIGGRFNYETKEIILSGNLTNKNILMICDALTKGFSILTFTLQNCVINNKDLELLFDTFINRSSIYRLIFLNVEVFKWMGMSKSLCHSMIVYFRNQLIKIQFSNECQKDETKMLVRLLRQNKICRTLQLFGYDLSNQNQEILRALKENQQINCLIIQHFMNIELLNEILNAQTSIRRLKLSFWLNTSSILFSLCSTIEQNRTLIELDLMDHSYPDEKLAMIELLKILRKHRSIKQFHSHMFNIKPSNELENCLIDTLTNDTFLTHLRISDSIISDELVQAFIYASNQLHTLVYLELYNCQLTDEQRKKIELLDEKDRLTHLIISEQSYWSNASKIVRQQMISEFPNYRNAKLEEKISQIHGQSSICLDNLELIDHDIEFIVKQTILDKQYQFLSLQSNKITSIGASILADTLSQNRIQIETLDLTNNYISDDGVESFVNSLSSQNHTLRTLILQKNKITDKGARYLAEMLKKNETLIWLYLGENEISNEGVRLIAQAIEQDNHSLEILILSSNKSITDLSIEYLISMLEKNQSLKKLWIDDCNLSDVGKKRLQSVQQTKPSFYLRV